MRLDDYVGYEKALLAAGAEVLAYKSFGSYQGDWYCIAKVEGRVKIVHGSYGSCSHCDAFENEFGYGARDMCDEHYYSRFGSKTEDPCEACKRAKETYDAKLIEFGKTYLDLCSQETPEAYIRSVKERLDWDTDSQEIIDWLTAEYAKATA